MDAIAIVAAAERPMRATARVERTPANATPKRDIDSRMPIAKTPISPSSTGSGADPTRSPNGQALSGREDC